MNDQRTLQFKLFGGFAYRVEENGDWLPMDGLIGGGKKLRSFLEYLTVNHNREITGEELIAQFWPDQSCGNPAGALKYTLHKARGVLKQLLGTRDEPILTRRGRYVWNPRASVELDMERFERLCLEAKNQTEGQSLDSALEACGLYTGDLLPGEQDQWARSLRIYCRTLYIDACKSALRRLLLENRWTETAALCERAYVLEPGGEEFTLSWMRALMALGQPDQAVQQYESYRALIWKEYAVTPSQEAERLYNQALETRSGQVISSRDVVRVLAETTQTGMSFLCSFGVFRSFVELELRFRQRDKVKSAILVVGVAETDPYRLNSTDQKRLERTLLTTLRAGDPFCRLNAGSYTVLLSGASRDETHRVMERVDKRFHKAYPRSKAHLQYTITTLEELRQARTNRALAGA